MKKRVLGIALSFVLCFSVLVGCSTSYELPYYDQMDEERGYDESLFYENKLEVAGADPSVIKITDEEDPYYGWFYMYPTGGGAYRSRDLDNWEYAGPGYVLEKESSAQKQRWAPDCIYDEKTDLYYYFFSARDSYRDPEDHPTRNMVGFRNKEDKLKYWFYRDWIFSEYLLADETSSDEIAQEENLQCITEMKAVLENRIAELTAAGAGVPISDGKENGYTTAYTQEQIDEVIAAYEKLDFTSTKHKTLLERTREALLLAYTVDLYSYSFTTGFGIHVAVSDNPAGPFYQYTNEEGKINRLGEAYNPDNRTVTIQDQFISTEDVHCWLKEYRSPYYKGLDTEYYIDENGVKKPSQMLYEGVSGYPAEISTEMIDVHTFVDPKTGKKYLYLVRDPEAGTFGFIFVVEMGEKWTDDPKWETTTRLTRGDFYTCDDMSKENSSKNDLNEASRTINEGPYVYYDKNSDNYYLTLSVNAYGSRSYAVIQAVGKSPFGPFRKLSKAEGGVLCASEFVWDHVAGPGHHSFVEHNGELFMVYHTHFDSITGTGERGIAFDPVVFVKNSNGETVMHLNGPTYSYMPKEGLDKVYRNIATEATVKANNIASGSDAKYLNDGVIKFYTWDDFISEFETERKGKTQITLTFDDYRAITAIMVFNSHDYLKHFESVKRIELDFIREVNGKTEAGTAYINDLKFDMDKYSNRDIEDEEFMRPGGSAIAEFYEMKVKEIRITMDTDSPIAISEIYVLGK